MSTEWPYPSIQGAIGGDWWVQDKGTVGPGSLITAFLPHVDVLPHILRVIGRTDARLHEKFDAVIEPLSIRADRGTRALPVAGLPQYPHEVYTLHRAKARPALVVAAPGRDIARSLTTGSAKWQTSRTFLVAPYYGVAKTGDRSGWKPEFVVLAE